MVKRVYNFRFSSEEERSLHPKYFSVINPNLDNLPEKVDLSSHFPPPFDQGELGSCTANALGSCVEFLETGFIPSRLFIYFNERQIQNTIDSDSGSTITTGINTLKTYGVCSESEWQYDPTKFELKPSDQCYNDAKKDLAEVVMNLQNLDEVKHCLATNYPVAFGFEVFSYFESEDMAKSGLLKMPEQNEQNLGGHAVCAVGYDDTTKMVKIRNSWGENWGDHGYFYMPYEYISNVGLAGDFWTIRKIL